MASHLERGQSHFDLDYPGVIAAADRRIKTRTWRPDEIGNDTAETSSVTTITLDQGLQVGDQYQLALAIRNAYRPSNDTVLLRTTRTEFGIQTLKAKHRE